MEKQIQILKRFYKKVVFIIFLFFNSFLVSTSPRTPQKNNTRRKNSGNVVSNPNSKT